MKTGKWENKKEENNRNKKTEKSGCERTE